MKVDLHHGTSCAETERMNSKEQRKLGGKRSVGSRYRYGLACGAGCAFLLSAGFAQAQTISKDTPPVVRSRIIPERTAEDIRWIINRAECEAENSTFTFRLLVNGWATGQSFQVWATTRGANCLDDDTRGKVDGGCVLLKPVNTISRIPGNTQQSVEPKFTTKALVGVESGLDEDCGASATDTGPLDLKIFFMLTSSNQLVMNGSTDWSTKIDLWGPDAPIDVTVSPGEASVELTPDGTPEENSTVVAYCAKDGAILDSSADEDSSGCSCNGAGNDSSGSGGSAGTTSSSSSSSSGNNLAAAGAGGMGGAGGSSGMGGAGGFSGMGGEGTGGSGDSGSTGNDGTCNEAPLASNALPDVNWVPCAEGNTVKDLENNVTYAIAVAYRDQVGNVGKLSPVVCATPSPIEDFFENYEKSGGSAGGGFCSMSHRTLRNTSFGTSFVLGALALVMRRRARQLRHASSKEVSK
jgi:hypothetical protein